MIVLNPFYLGGLGQKFLHLWTHFENQDLAFVDTGSSSILLYFVIRSLEIQGSTGLSQIMSTRQPMLSLNKNIVK